MERQLPGISSAHNLIQSAAQGGGFYLALSKLLCDYYTQSPKKKKEPGQAFQKTVPARRMAKRWLLPLFPNAKSRPLGRPAPDCRKTYITKRVVRPTPINPQKAATCAWLFALLKGQVCAKGVHTAPCKNSKKWPKPLFRHAQAGRLGGRLFWRGRRWGFYCFLGSWMPQTCTSTRATLMPAMDSMAVFTFFCRFLAVSVTELPYLRMTLHSTTQP